MFPLLEDVPHPQSHGVLVYIAQLIVLKEIVPMLETSTIENNIWLLNRAIDRHNKLRGLFSKFYRRTLWVDWLI